MCHLLTEAALPAGAPYNPTQAYAWAGIIIAFLILSLACYAHDNNPWRNAPSHDELVQARREEQRQLFLEVMRRQAKQPENT